MMAEAIKVIASHAAASPAGVAIAQASPQPPPPQRGLMWVRSISKRADRAIAVAARLRRYQRRRKSEISGSQTGSRQRGTTRPRPPGTYYHVQSGHYYAKIVAPTACCAHFAAAEAFERDMPGDGAERSMPAALKR